MLTHDEMMFTFASADAKASKMHPRVGCALFDKRGVLCGHGFNEPKTHPLQAKYALRVGRPGRIYLHAELAAILDNRRGAREAPHTACVVRLGKGGELRASFPCPVCLAALKHVGVSEVLYFDGNQMARTEV